MNPHVDCSSSSRTATHTRSSHGHALDVGMVNRIDVGVNHGGRLRIGAGHQDQGGVQHVRLS